MAALAEAAHQDVLDRNVALKTLPSHKFYARAQTQTLQKPGSSKRNQRITACRNTELRSSLLVLRSDTQSMADCGSCPVALYDRSSAVEVDHVLIEVAMVYHERVLIVDSDSRSIHH
jgi:hypothetical protein